LGPQLFLIYINGLPSFIQHFGPPIVLFSDDMSLIINELNCSDLENKLTLFLE
jgi:hypothetical protein